MGFRFYDWECARCGVVAEHLVSVPTGEDVPREMDEHCEHCGRWGKHERLMSCPGPYFGEKVINPQVHGGKYDTMGKKRLPRIDTLIDTKTRGEMKLDIARMKERRYSKEYQEIMKERASIKKENAAKQKRARAIAEGRPINMRRDRLPGDPKI